MPKLFAGWKKPVVNWSSLDYYKKKKKKQVNPGQSMHYVQRNLFTTLQFEALVV